MRLLQAAAGLFASRSFETVSTRAIAKEAGVDAALIHHYFGSKEGLFQAVLKSIIRPEDIEAEISISSRNSWGRELVHAVDRLWASPAAPAPPGPSGGHSAGHRRTLHDATRNHPDQLFSTKPSGQLVVILKMSFRGSRFRPWTPSQ